MAGESALSEEIWPNNLFDLSTAWLERSGGAEGLPRAEPSLGTQDVYPLFSRSGEFWGIVSMPNNRERERFQ